MGHYPCCCNEVVCAIYETGFTVADTSTVPSSTELNGDWEIIDGELHPDHADADQRILFATASSDLDVMAYVTITAADSGDEGGVKLAFDADADSYVQATMTLGAGSLGTLQLKRFDNGVLTWTHTIATSPQCGTNAYDFPDTEPLQYHVALRHRTVHGGSLWTLYLYDDAPSTFATAMAFPEPEVETQDNYSFYKVEYFDSAGVSPATSFKAGVVTGTDAVGLVFDNFRFIHLYPDCLCLVSADMPLYHRNYACDHVGMKYEEEEGDWDQTMVTAWWDPFGPTYAAITTTAEPATLLTRDILRSDGPHTCLFTYDALTGLRGQWITGLIFRYVFDWQDDDNYWCVEWEFGSLGVCEDYVRIIERAAGVETVHEEVQGYNRQLRNYGSGPAAFHTTVTITTDGYILAHISIDEACSTCDPPPATGSSTMVASGPHTFSGGGRQGWKVIQADEGFMLGYYHLFDGVGSCAETGPYATCDDLTPTDPPDSDDFFCCTELVATTVGDTIEMTLNSWAYFFGAPCPGVCGDSDYITDLNATHPLTVVYKSDVHIHATGSVAITTDCPGTDVNVRLLLWITNTGGGNCVARAAVVFGESVCTAWYKAEFTEDSACDGLELTLDTAYMTSIGLDPHNCCLAAGGTLHVNIP